ncbi:MAG: hypothetical protein ACXABY_26835 [Candidatus Thorarchaeota archaeon]|jgi:hypothetical protein
MFVNDYLRPKPGTKESLGITLDGLELVQVTKTRPDRCDERLKVKCIIGKTKGCNHNGSYYSGNVEQPKKIQAGTEFTIAKASFYKVSADEAELLCKQYKEPSKLETEAQQTMYKRAKFPNRDLLTLLLTRR